MSEFFTISDFSFWYFLSVDLIYSNFSCACCILRYRRSFMACRCILSPFVPVRSASLPCGFCGSKMVLLWR